MTPTTPMADPETILSALRWRYATKTFDASKKIPANLWSAIEQAIVLAPSSFGLQPWKFIVVNDPAVRAKLREKAWNQSQVTDASHYMVIARQLKVTEADVTKYIAATAEAKGIPASALEGYKGVIMGFVVNSGRDTGAWSARQSYIALGFALETAAMLGVDACPMEGFDPAGFDEILGLNGTNYTSAVTVSFGYRSPTDKYAAGPKIRYPASDVIRHV